MSAKERVEQGGTEKEIQEEILGFLHTAEEIDPDKHDPSYRLARTAAQLYAQSFPPKVGVEDLDMLLALVTFGSHEFRKQKIAESSLDIESKSQLLSLLESLQLKWENKEYETNELDESKDFGMFGAGFRTFKAHKMPRGDAEKLIRLFADISSDSLNDSEKLALVKDCFSDAIRGMRSASASEILHCIDPFTFPILNGHQGRDNLYPILIEKIPKSGNKRNDLTQYANYCEIIRDYRDVNFSNFRNYRVFDIEEKKLPKIRSKSAKCSPAQMATTQERIISLLGIEKDEADLELIKHLASAPNVFDIIKMKSYEIRHSNMLAWLLDPSQNHGLGDKYLKLFFARMRGEAKGDAKDYLRQIADDDMSDVIVSREKYAIVSGEKKYIDILITSDGADLAILVENKTRSKERDDQLSAYKEYAENYLTEGHIFYIYLTPNGEESSDPERWKSMSYRQLIDDLDSLRLSEDNLDPSVALILEHYSDIVRSELLEEGELRNRCREFYLKHHLAIDTIIDIVRSDGPCEIVHDGLSSALANMSEDERVTRLDLGEDLALTFGTPSLDSYLSSVNDDAISEDSHGETTFTIEIDEGNSTVRLYAPSEMDVQDEGLLWESDIKSIYNNDVRICAAEIVAKADEFAEGLLANDEDDL